jgi:hypothetical protein
MTIYQVKADMTAPSLAPLAQSHDRPPGSLLPCPCVPLVSPARSSHGSTNSTLGKLCLHNTHYSPHFVRLRPQGAYNVYYIK